MAQAAADLKTYKRYTQDMLGYSKSDWLDKKCKPLKYTSHPLRRKVCMNDLEELWNCIHVPAPAHWVEHSEMEEASGGGILKFEPESKACFRLAQFLRQKSNVAELLDNYRDFKIPCYGWEGQPPPYLDSAPPFENAHTHTHTHTHTNTHTHTHTHTHTQHTQAPKCGACGAEARRRGCPHRNHRSLVPHHIARLCPDPITTSLHLKSCKNCFRVKYCSRECQKLDWPEHKERCKETVKKKIRKQRRQAIRAKAQGEEAKEAESDSESDEVIEMSS